MSRRTQAWLLLGIVQLLSAAVFLLDRSSGTEAAMTGLPLDDSWIHLVYARSLAAFQGFAYNPGQQEAGFTSPLWVILLAPVFWLKPLLLGNLVLGVKLLGIAVAWLCSGLVYEVARRVSGPGLGALCAGLLVAADPTLCFAKLSGMEVLLASSTLLFALLAMLAAHPIAIGIALALVPLARPENALFCVFALPLCIMLLHDRGAWLRDGAAILVPSAIAGFGWLAFCLMATGRPLPNTFYAKYAGKGIEPFLESLGVVLGPMLFDLPWFFLGSGLLLLAIGAREMWRRAGRGLSVRRLTIGLILVYPVIFIVGIAWSHGLQQGWPFYWNRYFQPILPLLFIPIGLALGSLLESVVPGIRGPGRWRRLRAAAVLGLCLLPLGALPGAFLRSAHRYSENCEDINQAQVEIGRWLARHSEPGATIAANDAGAIRFFSERHVIDLVGLNTHEVLFGGRDAYLLQERPRYLVIFPTWFPQIAGSPDVRVLYSVRDENYTICDCTQDLMVVYEWLPRSIPRK